jgi:V-type H+-transporting ATPase subunit A
LGNPERNGSVTIVGAVSPPGGDFSEPVTGASLSIVQVFWRLEKRLAQRKHFPSVHWLLSYSKYMGALETYYEKVDSEFSGLRKKMKLILQTEEDLSEIVQLVGKDSLDEPQKLILDIAGLIKNDFLQQNGFTEWDKFCPFWKTSWMMRNFIHYYDRAHETLTGSTADHKLSWNQIKTQTTNVYKKLSEMKFQLPSAGEDVVSAWMKSYYDEITNAFRLLNDNMIFINSKIRS